MNRSTRQDRRYVKPAIVHPLADEETASSARWYDDKHSGLGDQFLDAVDEAYYEIEENPDTGIQVEFGLRMKTLHQFPFGIVFREHTAAIHVVAVHHFRRDSRYWVERDR